MLLLTRPYEDSMALAVIFAKEYCIVEPMITIEKIKPNFDKILTGKTQAIVSTSRNAILPETTIPIIKIPEYGQNAEEILQYCVKHLKKDKGQIIYLSGNLASVDIAAKLRAVGYDAKRVVTYKQVPATRLSQNFYDNHDKIRIATFFSEKTLENFKNLCESKCLSKITCICISEKVAKKADKMGWKSIQVAKQPNSAAMIAAIQQASLDS